MRLFALLFAASLTIGCGGGTVTWTPSLEAQSKQIMPTPQDDGRAVKLESVKNGRDIGGLAGMHAVVPTGRFFRSASTAHATEQDKQTLLARGVTTVIDLRTYWEVSVSPDALAHDSRFHYERESLFGFGLVDALTFAPSGTDYMNALGNHQGAFRNVFHALAEASRGKGAVLYHCASGKDRTGIVTAMLLSLAGVERSVIVH
ncbi:MAG TPA: tyrosine-protein phosphatase, partial [Polyangiaceae bacterium]